MHLVGVEDYENKLIFVLKRRDFKIYIATQWSKNGATV